jgi:hypothetical protein
MLLLASDSLLLACDTLLLASASLTVALDALDLGSAPLISNCAISIADALVLILGTGETLVRVGCGVASATPCQVENVDGTVTLVTCLCGLGLGLLGSLKSSSNKSANLRKSTDRPWL